MLQTDIMSVVVNKTLSPALNLIAQAVVALGFLCGSTHFTGFI